MAAPANDNVANAAVLTSGTSISGSTAEATIESGETRDGTAAPGYATVWFAWRAPSTASAQFSTVGSAFDTYLSVRQAKVNAAEPVTTFADLEFIAGDDDAGGSGTSRVTINPVTGRTYYIQVGGYDNDSGSYTLNYPAPGTALAPANDLLGDAVVLPDTAPASVVAVLDGAGKETGEGGTATPTVWYRWKAGVNAAPTTIRLGAASFQVGVWRATDGQPDPVSDVTNLTLVTEGAGLASFTSEPDRIYYLQVGGVSGAVGRVDLHVQPNDDLAGASVYPVGTASITGSNVGFTLESGEGQSAGHPVMTAWLKWTPPAGAAQVDTIGSAFDTFLGVWKASGNVTSHASLTNVGFDDDGGGSSTSKLTFAADGTSTYYIQVGGYDISKFGRYVVRAFVAQSGRRPVVETRTAVHRASRW